VIEQPIGHRPIDWGSVLTVVVLVIGAVIAFVVVREKQERLVEDLAELRGVDRTHTEQIAKIREDRSIERQLNELTLKVELLRQEVAQGNKDKRR